MNNGVHIQSVYISGVLIGFLYNEEEDLINQKKEYILTICFLMFGIRITFW
jgi:uncharacterized membrane protein YbjE (DUF340 family)